MDPGSPQRGTAETYVLPPMKVPGTFFEGENPDGKFCNTENDINSNIIEVPKTISLREVEHPQKEVAILQTSKVQSGSLEKAPQNQNQGDRFLITGELKTKYLLADCKSLSKGLELHSLPKTNTPFANKGGGIPKRYPLPPLQKPPNPSPHLVV